MDLLQNSLTMMGSIVNIIGRQRGGVEYDDGSLSSTTSTSPLPL